MMNKKIILAAMMVAASVLFVNAGEAFLAKDAVIAFEAPKTTEMGELWAERAAEDLAMVLKKVVGVEIRIVKEDELTDADKEKAVIYVGDTKAAKEAGLEVAKLKSAEAYMRAVKGRAFIASRTGMGVNNAVMEFLQRYCDYYFVNIWDPENDPYEKKPELAIPEHDFVLKPAYEVLDILGGNLFPNTRKVYFAKQRSNPTYFAKRYPFERRNRMTYLYDEADQEHLLSTKVSSCHSQYDYLPPEKYYKDHPEWYSMNEKGERPANANKGSQLCYSNLEMRDELWKNMRGFILADRAEKLVGYPTLYDFTQMDACNHLCLCSNCWKIISKYNRVPGGRREGGDSGLQLEMVNDLARRLQKEFPDVRLRIYAYSSNMECPAGIKPEPNVDIQACDLYSYSDHTTPLGEGPLQTERGKLIEDWGKVANLEIWDYWITGPRCGNIFPEFNLRAIASDAKWYRKLGVKRYFAEHQIHTEAQWTLIHFILGQMFFNPDRDVDELLGKYCRIFGKDADAFHEAVNYMLKRMVECGYTTPTQWNAKAYPWRNRETWNHFLKMIYPIYTRAEGTPKAYLAHYLAEVCRELLPIYRNDAEGQKTFDWLVKHFPQFAREAATCMVAQDKVRAEYLDDADGFVAMLTADFSDKPECFKGVSNIDAFSLDWHGVPPRYRKRAVDDPKSSVGKAFVGTGNTAKGKIGTGVYFDEEQKTTHMFFEIPDGEENYKWYRLGASDIAKHCTFYIFRSWVPHFNVGRYWHPCDGKEDDNHFEFWVSARRDPTNGNVLVDRAMMRRVPREQ